MPYDMYNPGNSLSSPKIGLANLRGIVQGAPSGIRNGYYYWFGGPYTVSYHGYTTMQAFVEACYNYI